MAVNDPHYAVGIDLGTTNSAVSFAPLLAEKTKRSPIKRFQIPQLTGNGEFSRFPVLPSFLYLPGRYEISEAAIAHPWRMPTPDFAGTFARDFGAKIPNRLVTSAKSWLCEKGVDRRAAILPWGAPEEVRKVSPVEASAAYLNHIRQAWNRTQGEEEERYLENQLVVITVPASFDEVARELTLEASSLAGLPEVTLLEEPLAAFYSWLTVHESDWAELVAPEELILVCDVGGGTTDFTLISLRKDGGAPRFERIAVGDHLILGGDNLDLALARHIENELSRPLGTEKLKTLCHQCRQAKENILNGNSDSERITLMGEGKGLIAGTISATLNRQTLTDIINQNFFPLTPSAECRPAAEKKTLSEFGLSYESTTAVTAHLLEFLRRHQPDRDLLVSASACPDLILFNGGTLKPALIQERIRKSLQTHLGGEQTAIPRILDNPSHDAAVSLGAAYYGLVKTGRGVKVGSGSPRSYYLAVSGGLSEEPAAESPSALCVVERGLEEGSTITLHDYEMGVMTNQKVRFDLYSSSFRSGDRHGDIIPIDDSVTLLPPLQTVIQFGEKGLQKTIPVEIEAQYTEIGSLVLWCRSRVSRHRWQLQFQLRELGPELALPETGHVLEAAKTESALEIVRRAFALAPDGITDKKQLAAVTPEICRTVGISREKWPISFLRTLADLLLENRHWRQISPDHEHRWMNLTGFAMRPGIGDGYDSQRIQQLWKTYNQGLSFPNQTQVRTECWIFVRRLACGLKPGQQKQFLQDVTPIIMPRKGDKKKHTVQEIIEIWMAVANMERLLVKDKINCGRSLLPAVLSKKSKPQYLWALSRLGAREMLYGSADRVIPPEEAARWIEAILAVDWRRPRPAGAAVVQLARKTGDRTRDIDADTAAKVTAWLRRQNLPEPYVAAIETAVPLEKQDESIIFGESLPLGLVLKPA